MYNVGGLKLSIEIDEFGIVHPSEKTVDETAGFKARLEELVSGAVKLSGMKTAFDEKKFRYGNGKLYLQYKYLAEIFPLINKCLKEQGREVISGNEVVAAFAFGQIAELLFGRFGTDVCYGLLKGRLEYIDLIKYPSRYNLNPFGDNLLTTPDVRDEIRAYHEKYGNDLSHVDDMSEDAVCALDKLMASVFHYDMIVRGMTMDMIREYYGHPMRIENYFSSFLSIARALCARLDMKHIFRMLDCLLSLYPRESFEHARITEAFLLRSATADCTYVKGKAEAYSLMEGNPIAVIMSEAGAFGHSFLSEWLPAEIIVACRTWIDRNMYDTYYKKDGRDFEAYIDDRVKRQSVFYADGEETARVNKGFFHTDRYLGQPVVYEYLRKKNELLWKYASDQNAYKEAYMEVWNDNPTDYTAQVAGENITEAKTCEELMKLSSSGPEDCRYHLPEGKTEIKSAGEKVEYYHNKIINKTDQLENMIDRLGLNLDERSRSKLKAFVTGKFQMKYDEEMGFKVDYPCNNLILIYEEEEDYSPEIIKYLNRFFGCRGDVTLAQADELHSRLRYFLGVDEYDYEFDDSGDGDTKPKNLICVVDFKTHPFINVETGTGSAQEREKEEYRRYKTGWDELIELARENPRLPFVIVTSKRIFRESYVNNAEIIYRTFKYHAVVESMREDQVYDRTLNMLYDEEEFGISSEFKKKLKKYIDVIYREADLKGTKFVKDLKNRILTLYYEKLRDDHMITEDCIPKYSADVPTPGIILDSMKDLVGLNKVKETIRSIYTNLLIEKSDPKKKALVKRPLHMKFTGNPGTGKTTVARRLMELYYSMGVIHKKRFVETKPSGLMSYWSSGTNIKAKSVIESAYGGVLFIDEAYGFINNGDRGMQALQEVLIAMENHPDELIVIMAGYKEEMRSLMKANSGLNSRFAYELEFEDYSTEELIEIFRSLCKTEGLSIAESAVPSLENCILSKRSGEFFGNAREVRNIFNRVKEAWAKRIYGKTGGTGVSVRPEEQIITEADFEQIMPKKRELGISDMIGLTGLKKKLEEFKQQVIYQRYLREHGVKLPAFSMHMLFMGNPGTGKTTVAKMIAEELYSIGILKTNQLVVAEKKDLVTGVVAETAAKTADVIKRARGGVLFVDEAYSLTDGKGAGDKGMTGHGHEAIETLITAMEDCKEDTVFIFAGYTNEMNGFLESNPGIASRIGYTFSFDDYTPDELMEIYDKKMEGYGLITRDAARKKIYDLMSYFSEVPNFGNGRFVDHVIHQIILKRAERFDINAPTGYKEIYAKDIPGHKELIETAPNRDELYDPSEITKASKRRTAIHECGHAVVGYVLDKKRVPESISVRSGAVSFGRVMLGKQSPGSKTERELKNMIAELLGGRNAERVFFGENATGVSEDYDRAKRLARSMIRDFAMGELGNGNALDILREEDRRATGIIEKHKDFIDSFADRLLAEKEVSGEDMVKAFKEFYRA